MQRMQFLVYCKHFHLNVFKQSKYHISLITIVDHLKISQKFYIFSLFSSYSEFYPKSISCLKGFY